MIKAIIFDFFGVIRTDAYESWLHANGLTKTGPYMEISKLQDAGTITSEEFFVRLSKLAGRPVTLPQLDERARIHHDTLSLIDRLRPQYRIACLSNSPIGLVRHLMATAGIEHYFDDIIISSEVHLIKPSPEIFELTLKKLKVPAEGILFIDDNQSHVDAAIGVGIKSLLFTTARQLELDLAGLGITINPA